MLLLLAPGVGAVGMPLNTGLAIVDLRTMLLSRLLIRAVLLARLASMADTLALNAVSNINTLALVSVRS